MTPHKAMSHMKQLEAQYSHALLRMFDVFKAGVLRESELEDKLKIAREKIHQLSAENEQLKRNANGT